MIDKKLYEPDVSFSYLEILHFDTSPDHWISSARIFNELILDLEPRPIASTTISSTNLPVF